MLWCTKIYIIFSRSSPRSCIPYACTAPWSDHRQSHMPWFYQWVNSPPSVWVSGCVLRPMRWVWGSWWQLLCCPETLRVTGGWKLWPQTVITEPDLWSQQDNIRRSRAAKQDWLLNRPGQTAEWPWEWLQVNGSCGRGRRRLFCA